MRKKPKHQFWRFHLLTAVLMAFTLGVLGLANTQETRYVRGSFFGWPFHCYFSGRDLQENLHFVIRHGFSLLPTIENVIVSFLVLALVAITSESILRRCETRRQLSKKPKRRILQLHLSTAITLSFVAAGLSYVNVSAYSQIRVVDRTKWPLASEFEGVSGQRGWPFSIYDWEYLETEHNVCRVYVPFNIAANAAVALMILLSSARACEYATRRREGLKT